MKKKKGFTLIELLAVIVILAVIALIAVPTILKVLENARKAAAEDSVYGVAESAETYVADLMLNNSGTYPGIELEFECDGTKCELTTASKTALTSAGVTYKDMLQIKGKIPASGTVTISASGHLITGASLVVNGYTCVYSDHKATCAKGENAQVSSFATDSWSTIAANVKAGTTSGYHLGDTKTIEMDVDGDGTNEIYSLRIVNMSTPAECYTDGFSQSACGFVVEFGGATDSNDSLVSLTDIKAPMYFDTTKATSSATSTSTGSATGSSVNYPNDVVAKMSMSRNYEYEPPHSSGALGTYTHGGWEYSEIRAYLNNGNYETVNQDDGSNFNLVQSYSSTGLFGKLPTELKNVIITTTVVSDVLHDPEETSNVSYDKLYIFSEKELLGTYDQNANAASKTRQLDYYQEHSDNGYYLRKFESNGTPISYWLRSFRRDNAYHGYDYAYYSSYNIVSASSDSSEKHGVVPAFRIGNFFESDSLETIVENAKNGNTLDYHAGDYKTIALDLNGDGTNESYKLKVVNNSTPAECSTTGFSQTGCGFVLEVTAIQLQNRIFAYNLGLDVSNKDQINAYLNSKNYAAGNVDYTNTGFLSKLPSVLKDNIIDTFIVTNTYSDVVDDHPSNVTSSTTSTEKVYLTAYNEARGSVRTATFEPVTNLSERIRFFDLGASDGLNRDYGSDNLIVPTFRLG